MKIILITLSLLISNFAYSAGVMNGGGGQSVVCRDSGGKIKSAEMLDVFEAREIFGLTPRTYSGTLDAAVASLKTDLMSTMDQPDIHLFPIIERVQKNMRLVSSAVVLKPIDDAALVAVPRDCAIEQLAVYVDETLLLVSEEIWNSLNVTNRAALVMHEAIYRLERYSDVTDSRRARKIVGHLISGFAFEPVRGGRPPRMPSVCTATLNGKMIYNFLATPTNGGTMTEIQFYVYEGKFVFSKKTSVLPIAMPWMKAAGLVCHPDGRPHYECVLAGGDVHSNFEGNDMLTLGYSSYKTAKTVEQKFFFESGNDRGYLECSP